MHCEVCGHPQVYANGGRLCTKSTCGHYVPERKAAPAPAQEVLEAEVIEPEPATSRGAGADPPRAVAEGAATPDVALAELGEAVQAFGRRVKGKLERDAATAITTPDQIQRVGEEWIEIIGDGAGLFRRAKGCLSALKRGA